MNLAFQKMHGLGNDFAIFDARHDEWQPGEAQIHVIADRHIGVGCDQMIVMESAQTPDADVFMRIYNPDGSQAGACGNATRCVAALLFADLDKDVVRIETQAGILHAQKLDDGRIQVDMGTPGLEWHQVPLASEADTLLLDIAEGPLALPTAVSMGNPHAVFFVDRVDEIDLEHCGPLLEHHPLFPERTNVEIAEIISPTVIRMRVWERGAGITQACGSGACATLVAAVRRGLVERKAEVQLDGGVLEIAWDDNNHVLMAGPVSYVYTGVLDAATLEL